ncbi:TetR family transcriptional regulator [Microterricola gilva]|uniref:TetR family transcriptional regulator n=1 Tax=Microterricola gilva TaxID=393267 RepID=A0A4V6MGI7_9MICO|nr:TetR family transcriptional regulator C-terminal domain-containing protein [Microterricola gilva]RZU65146.1 TetR family transcriptional regulator [Microterricola gilva]
MESTARAVRKSAGARAAEIRGSACAIALENGLSALTLRSVAAHAGVTSALVAHYVDGMDALIAETFAHITGQELDDVSARVADGSPTRRLHTLCFTLLDGSSDEVTVVWVEGWAMGRRNPALAEAIRRQMDLWEQLFSAVIEDGVAAGEFVTDDPAAVAWQLLGMIDGLNAQALVTRALPGPRGALIAGAVEGMLRMRPGSLALA